MHCRSARLPLPEALSTEINPKYIHQEDYATDLVLKLSEAWKQARVNLAASQN